MQKPALLVLTATITPPDGVPNLKRVAPSLRRRDYIDALRFYLSLPNEVVDRIVFLENSESDLSDLQELARIEGDGKRVEFISFQGLDYPPQYGRAFGEFKMLDYGVQHSVLLKTLDEHDCFWKVTGRLKILNLDRLIRTAPSRYGILMDFLRKPTPMVDLRLLSCSRAGYRQRFEGSYVSFREDVLKMSVEGYLYSLWVGRLDEFGIIPRHRWQPKIGGVGGQHNVDYYAGLNVAKYWVRFAARLFLPRLWI
jgi:hypothetical protein